MVKRAFVKNSLKDIQKTFASPSREGVGTDKEHGYCKAFCVKRKRKKTLANTKLTILERLQCKFSSILPNHDGGQIRTLSSGKFSGILPKCHYVVRGLLWKLPWTVWEKLKVETH